MLSPYNNNNNNTKTIINLPRSGFGFMPKSNMCWYIYTL